MKSPYDDPITTREALLYALSQIYPTQKGVIARRRIKEILEQKGFEDIEPAAKDGALCEAMDIWMDG